jgi:rhodanese-related sulfurtransferase
MKLMGGDTNILIVDNRFKADFTEERIRGAINFPWKSKIWRPAGLPQDRLLIFYCDCGFEESSVDIATQLVEDWGYNKGYIRVLKGGWSWWKALGYPTEKGYEAGL